jgi:2-oxoglutarate ferredoxin oxidoreductase subunit beta
MSTNAVGLEKKDYQGVASTLCKGCGHDSVTSALVSALFEVSIDPRSIIKLSGIGCSSKTTNYFLNQSFGFNSVHGRMAPLATGVHLAQPKAKLIGVSGDGDTASIGLGSFLHLVRRNVPMVYIVENNGVYGLTKGQFSATSFEGDKLKGREDQNLQELDVLDLALSAGCEFIARAFAGSQVQLKQILKLALAHNGSAVIDVVSPCVAYGNKDQFSKSYTNTQDHSVALHEIDIIVDGKAFEEHELQYNFKPISEIEYNNSSLLEARKLLLEEKSHNTLHTGVLYLNSHKKTLNKSLGLDDKDSFSQDNNELKLKKEQFNSFVERWSLT